MRRSNGGVVTLMRINFTGRGPSHRLQANSWFQIDPPPLESVQDLRRFLEFHERGELPVDVLPINPPALRHDATKTGFQARSVVGGTIGNISGSVGG